MLMTQRNLLILLIMVAAAAMAQQEQPPTPEFKPDRTVVYKAVEGDDLKLDIFQPRGWERGDRRPAIVFFFGGGWTGGTTAQFYPHSRLFALRGMVAISAQYRTKSSHGTDPFACIEDGKSAIRWVHEHAAELGIDPNRVSAGGGSAGGHVAATTAVLKGLEEPTEDGSISSRPKALVLFNPVIDTTEKGYGAEKLGTRQLAASPVHHVRPGLPPTIIFHGTADTTVPFENVKRFQAEMRKTGNECELVPYEGEAHGFFNYTRNFEAYLDSTSQADAFLNAHGLAP